MNTKWKQKEKSAIGPVWNYDGLTFHYLDVGDIIEVTTPIENIQSYDVLKKIPFNEHNLDRVECVSKHGPGRLMSNFMLVKYFERIE